jgi:hypothetical protein
MRHLNKLKPNYRKIIQAVLHKVDAEVAEELYSLIVKADAVEEYAEKISFNTDGTDINTLFTWSATPQGDALWLKVHDKTWRYIK